jgi:site-specific recombinase XerD
MVAASTELYRSEILDYMRHIRPRIASTTYTRKLWQIQAFARWLSKKEKHYATVTRADVEDYLSGLHCSQQFRQAMCAVVREFYEFLKIRHPLLCPEENPAAGIEFKPDKSRKLPNVPSQAAMDEIFARLYEKDDDLHIRDRLMAELAYGSGLRRAELARLDIEDIDLEAKTAQIMGKGNKPRVVPLTEKTVVTVREYLARRHASRGPLLVSFFGRRLGLTGVYGIMRDRVGMRPHLFRHACATHLLKNGCGIRVIQELLGHERIDTTYIYTAVTKENLRKVILENHPRAVKK